MTDPAVDPAACVPLEAACVTVPVADPAVDPAVGEADAVVEVTVCVTPDVDGIASACALAAPNAVQHTTQMIADIPARAQRLVATL